MNARTCIRVAHYIKDAYPDSWEPLHSASLWKYGPSMYNLREVQVLSPSYSSILSVINDVEVLKGYLGLQDALKIAKRGPIVLRSIFGFGKDLFCLKSVATRDGRFCAPCLSEYGDQVGVFWVDLSGWDENCLLARFPVS